MTRPALLLLLGLAVYGQTRKPASPKPAAPKAAAAAPVADPGTGARTFPIVSLTVEGNRTYKAEQILKVADIQIGQPVDQGAFEAARNRLLESGFFETVGFKYAPSDDKSGYAASFQVLEVAQVYPVGFDRLKKPVADLKAVLSKADPLFSDKVPGTKQILERYAKLLEPLAGERVVGKVTADGLEGELRIMFQPVTMPPSVAEVRFVKNEVLPGPMLQNAIAGAAIGAVYEEAKFRQVVEASLRPVYEARGRLRVTFPKFTTEPVADVNGLRVTIEVSEGETYTLGGVRVLTQATSDTELIKAGDLKLGDIANMTEVTAAVERMRAVVRRTGYVEAKSTVERRLDDDKKKLYLTVKIDGGKRYTFSKLTIAGLDIISEPQIRKAWTMKPGDPFNPEYPDYFLNRMREEGVFENLGKTKADVKTDDEKGTADVTLSFGAAPPHNPDQKKSGRGRRP